MAFQVSPGVNVSEIDATSVVPATSTTEGAIAGVFRWGPVNERILVSSEVELAKRFGKPLNSKTSVISAAGTAETATFDALVLPTSGGAGTDTWTLTVGSESYATAAGDYTTKSELATAIQSALTTAGVSLFTVAESGSEIVLTWATSGNQVIGTYGIAYTGSGTGNTDDADPTIVQGTADTVTNTQWSNVETYYSAADFLAYGNALYVVRVSDGTKAISTTNTDLRAKYPGAMGNTISVKMVDVSGYTSNDLGFDYAPSTNNFHMEVYVDGKAVERYENVSLVQGSTGPQGGNNYIVEVLQNQSVWIEATGVTNIAADVSGTAFSSGTDGSDEGSIATGTLQTGYDLFANAEEVDISLILQGKARGVVGTGYTTLGNYVTDIATARKDCVAFVSPAKELVVGITNTQTILDNLTGSAATSVATSGTRSTYAVVDTGYKYRYDKHNDAYIYTPMNADVAGLCVRTDNDRDPWFSPAGLSRGIIKNIVKLAYNPSKAHRDVLYKKNINPVITQSGQGTLLFGDKTFANATSAFDRINVRRLFIVLEKTISVAAKQMLFEFNDEFTRAQFRNLIEPFLRDVQGRRGIYDFKVVADDTNNTAEVIDSNRFVGDIFIKPARSINFIQLNFVAVRTGVEFAELVGQQ